VTQIRHQTCDLPVFSAVPQPTGPQRAPSPIKNVTKFWSSHVCSLRLK